MASISISANPKSLIATAYAVDPAAEQPCAAGQNCHRPGCRNCNCSCVLHRIDAALAQRVADFLLEQVDDIAGALAADGAEPVEKCLAGERRVGAERQRAGYVEPVRTPELRMIVARLPTASTIAGNTSIELGRPSI